MSRYRCSHAEQAASPVALRCRVLGVARSGDDAWARRGASARAGRRGVDRSDRPDPRRAPPHLNALAARCFATLTAELIDTRPWPSHRAARPAIFAWSEVFSNRRRAHAALGYRRPATDEMALAQEAQAV